MSNTAPAEGERRGLGGYVRQYRDVAASLIYAKLLERDERAIDSVDLVDPRAGKVDDVQFRSRTHHDAYQVKWTSTGGRVTLRSLTTAGTDETSPLRQLYDAWSALQQKLGAQTLRVHWITNAQASEHPERKGFVGDNTNRPKNATMAGFLKEVHAPLVKHDAAIPAEWQMAWKSLRRAAGNPPKATFADFMRACRFDLGYAAIDPVLSPEGKRQYKEDIQAIWSCLMGEVADSQRGQRLEITRDLLLDITGLGERLRRNNPHEFPDPDIPAVDVPKTLEALHRAVDDLSTPYAGLLGPPGSGKSTLLSAFARKRQDRGDLVVQYYAYTGGDDPKTAVRGESAAFLQDIVLTLQRRGAGLETIPGQSRTALLNEFHRQIQALGERYRATGSMSVLVVDGLDHVNRQNSDRGFLADLPLPGQLPEGVTVLVGSQTEQLERLPVAVRESLGPGSPGRIETVPFGQDDVARVLTEAASGFTVDLPDGANQVAWERTEGNPLALALLVNRLRQARDADDVHLALNEAARPDRLYSEIWREVEDRHSICHLLGLIARVPGPIDLVWFTSWFEDAAAVSFVFRRLGHLFRQEGDDRWHVFHDSFRVFVLEQTGKYMPGGWDVALHEQLARQAERSAGWHGWTELYHRDKAGDRNRVSELAQPHVAREQFAAFRPPRSIASDLAVAGGHAAESGDTALLVAIAAAAEEVSLRRGAVERYVSHPALNLARYGQLAEAARLARSDRELYVDPRAALYLAVLLHRGGLNRDAGAIYDLARPRRLLSLSGRGARDDEKVYWLRAWAHAAPLFEPLHAIAAQIGRLSVQARDLHFAERFHQQSDDEATNWFRRSLSLQVVESLLEDERWDDEREWVRTHLVVAVPSNPEGDESTDADEQLVLARVESRLEAASALLTRGDMNAAIERLEPFNQQGKDGARAVAEAVGRDRAVQAARLLHATGATDDEVSRWLPTPPEPIRGSRWLGLELRGAFHLIRLQSLLGLPVPTVPDRDEDSRDEGVNRLRRGVVQLARLSADAQRGVRRDADTVQSMILPLFSQIPNASLGRYREGPSWDDHAQIVQDRWWLYSTAVSVAAEHGPAARTALLDAIAVNDTHPASVIITNVYDPDAYWTARDIREVAESAHEQGAPRAWVRSFLKPLGPYAASHDDLDTRTEELVALASTWNEVGDSDAAYRTFLTALASSFGVGFRKDYQLSHIVSLLGWLLDAGQDRLADGDGARWIEHVARVIETSSLGTESRQAEIAAQALVGHAFAWRPQAGVALAGRFLSERFVWEPHLTMEILQAAVLDDPEAVPLATDILVHQALPKRPQDRGLSDSYPEFTRLLVSQAERAPALSPDTFARDLCARIDDLNASDTLGSRAEGWKRGIGEALRLLGLAAVADDLGIEATPQTATTFEPHEEVIYLDDLERRATWQQLLDRVQRDGLPCVLAAFYTPEEASVWTHTVVVSAPGLTAVAARETADFVTAHPEVGHRDVHLALFRSLSSHGLKALAWQFGEAVLERTRRHYDPWSPMSSRNPGLTAAAELVEVDPDGARPAILRVLAYDAAVRPGAVFPWLSSLLPLLEPHPDPASHWRPIEDYLSGLEPTVSLESLSPPETVSPRCNSCSGLFEYVLALLPDSTHAHRLAPVILAELERWRPASQRALAEALEGPDDVRRPLLRVLKGIAKTRPDLLQPLLESLRRADSVLPSDLRPDAQYVIERVQASVDQDPTLAALNNMLSEEDEAEI